MAFDRRSYLKGTVLTGSVLAGLGGISLGAGQSSGASQQGDRLMCPAGTVELARFDVEDREFELTNGENVLTDVTIETDLGPLKSFSWESEVIIAETQVKFGPNQERFEGGFEGTIDLSEEQQPISEVLLCGPRGGRGVLCDIDMSGSFEVATMFDGDPADAGREGVVHVVSSEKTTDYAHGMVNVVSQTDDRIKLNALNKVQLDYFEGANNEGVIPDELFVSILTPEDELKLAVRTLDLGVEAKRDKEWQTLKVLNRMREEGWSIEDISFTDLRTSEAAIETARSLRDDPDETGKLTAKGPDETGQFDDATLVGVGFGAGDTRNERQIDRYFDKLSVNREISNGNGTNETVNFDFPAVLSFPVEDISRQGRGSGPLNVSLELETGESDIGVDDIAQETIKLNEFKGFAPPTEDGIKPQQIEFEDGRINLRFRPPDLDSIDVESKVIISGDFDVPTGSSFFAVGEL